VDSAISHFIVADVAAAACRKKNQKGKDQGTHKNLRCDVPIIGAHSHSHKLGQTLVCEETQCRAL